MRWKLVAALGIITGFIQPANAQNDAQPHNGFWQNEYCVNPSVPYMVRQSPAEGEVSVLFDITADGKPENIRVAEASSASGGDRFAEAFAKSTTRAVKRWEYFAYINEGVEAPRFDVALTFNFVEAVADAPTADDDANCVISVLPEPPSSAGDPGDPFASLARCMPPQMPRQADEKKASSVVKVTFNVTPEGKITDLLLAPGQAENSFSKEARRALRQWRYKPFLKAGVPVARQNLLLGVTFGEQAEGAGLSCGHAPFGSSVKFNTAAQFKKCEVKFNDGVPVPSKECYQSN